MNKIIVNADDFGYNDTVNEAIINGIEHRYITSTTIMASGDAFEEAIKYAKLRNDISFGVHLCIDEFKPLTSERVFKQYGLTDNDGRFIKFSYLNLHEADDIKEAIYNEWKAQILKVKNSGLQISHIDSHHHAHTYSFLYKIIDRLSKEFCINKVRICLYKPLLIKYREKPVISLKKIDTIQSPKKKYSRLQIFKNNFNLGVSNYRLKKKYRTTDFFCPLRYFIANKLLLSHYDVIEIMVHPGLPYYQNETELLPKLRQDSSLTLISYNEL